MVAGHSQTLGVIIIIFTLVDYSHGMVDGLYCGLNNCYDVLEVTREASKSEIAKSYRQLAKKFHPDRHQGEAKEEASEKFKIIATAYEVLKDEETRIDYDYMLDNPQEYYRHYYHYYKRKVSPKVDVRLVIAVSITVISIFQYYTARFRWSSGLRYLSSQVKYRQMALKAAEEEGLLDDVKKMKKRNKEEIKAEEERIILAVLESKMDIRGGYAKPKIRDVLWMQIIFLPHTIYCYLAWYVTWTWKFNIKKEEYGPEEKDYLIRKNLKLSETQYEAVPEEEKEEFHDRELWKRDCYQEWKLKKTEEMKRQMAESAKYKSYRRYMKKHGPGRMTFDDS